MAAWAIIEETGAAQHYRDARIAADLRGHQRHPGDRSGDPQVAARGRRHGEGLSIGEMRRTVAAVDAANDPAFGWTGAAAQGGGRLARARDPLAARPGAQRPRRRARPARRPICGCSRSRPAARSWRRRRSPRRGSPATAPMPARAPPSRASSRRISPVQASGLERTVVEGADSVNDADAALREPVRSPDGAIARDFRA